MPFFFPSEVIFPISYDAVKEKLLYEKTSSQATKKISKKKTEEELKKMVYIYSGRISVLMKFCYRKGEYSQTSYISQLYGRTNTRKKV